MVTVYLCSKLESNTNIVMVGIQYTRLKKKQCPARVEAETSQPSKIESTLNWLVGFTIQFVRVLAS
jgi:hypothetical protein